MEGEWVSLREVTSKGFNQSSTNSDVFLGLITIGLSDPNSNTDDGYLKVATGDTVTITYYGTNETSAEATGSLINEVTLPVRKTGFIYFYRHCRQ